MVGEEGWLLPVQALLCGTPSLLAVPTPGPSPRRPRGGTATHPLPPWARGMAATSGNQQVTLLHLRLARGSIIPIPVPNRTTGPHRLRLAGAEEGASSVTGKARTRGAGRDRTGPYPQAEPASEALSFKWHLPFKFCTLKFTFNLKLTLNSGCST